MEYSQLEYLHDYSHLCTSQDVVHDVDDRDEGVLLKEEDFQ